MIFVAVGTQKFPFDRLLKGIDDLIAQGQLEADVFAQIGHTDYVPQNYQYQNFLSKDDFQSYISGCDLLITHSGVATIIAGMKLEKPVVVVPRFASYGEHVDDHQLQLIGQFTNLNLICACGDPEDLEKALEEVKCSQYAAYISNTDTVIRSISDYLTEVFG